ncbi:MAG: YiiX/YebB-like N1pC/P60 family cysteine hydrolase [Neptuniibacter sp.]
MKTSQLDQLELQVSNNLQEGDIIFISINSPLYRQVAQGTGSWTSHVGFVVKEENQWFVLESAVPTVKRCSLRKFLSRTMNSEVCIKRLSDTLQPEQILRLKQVASKRMGRFYHLGFNFDSERQFCSKFVYLTFKEALGIEIGKVQTFRQLLAENPQASVNFWRCWYFGFIPWERKTITPTSQLIDPQLIEVFSTVSSPALEEQQLTAA